MKKINWKSIVVLDHDQKIFNVLGNSHSLPYIEKLVCREINKGRNINCYPSEKSVDDSIKNTLCSFREFKFKHELII